MTTEVSERRIIFWISAGHFLNHVSNYLTPALLIYLQADIILNQTERGLLGSIPMIILVLLSIFVGWLGDVQPSSKKPLIYGGILGSGLFCILISFSNDFIGLAFSTVILGISLSVYHPLAFTYLNNMPHNDKNMGINAVSGNLGSAVTPLLAMIFAVLFNWRISFILFGLIHLIVGLGFALNFPKDEDIMSRIDTLNEEENTKNGNTGRDFVSFVGSNRTILILLIVAISAARAPIFRSISYFTTVVFKDAFNFNNIESSILTAIVLGVGSLAAFLAGTTIDRKISSSHANCKKRINIRANTMLLSNGVASIVLILLVIFSSNEYLAMIIYITLTFFFFLGAAILPTITSEITGTKGMSSTFGILFTGGTLAGAIAPTFFGFLVDTYGFNEGFIFLFIVAIICFTLIFFFKHKFNSIVDLLT